MTSRARSALLVATACGVVHAASSLYWALGGDLLAGTVGRWAVAWAEQEPVTVGLVLTAVAVAKLALVALGWLAVTDRLPAGRRWRTAVRVIAALLLGYGLLNAAGAWVVLLGIVGVDDPDSAGLWGHAAVWDPLFAAWGVALLLALGRRRSRRARAAPTPVAVG